MVVRGARRVNIDGRRAAVTGCERCVRCDSIAGVDARTLIDRRYSCRTYLERPLAASDREALTAYMATRTRGPLGSAVRFGLIAASPDDAGALRRLGTYGFIKGATGYIAGAVHKGPGDLEDFGRPLGRDRRDGYDEALEAVRMAPSATNKQPWRVVRRGDDWHFYLLRTRGYGKGSPFFKVLRIADLQRVDLGIAMCHFELVARECGRAGRWLVADPGLPLPGPGIEYTATWRG